jgi:hypothetical protein
VTRVWRRPLDEEDAFSLDGSRSHRAVRSTMKTARRGHPQLQITLSAATNVANGAPLRVDYLKANTVNDSHILASRADRRRLSRAVL